MTSKLTFLSRLNGVPELSAVEVRVLLVITLRTNAHGENAWPSMRTIGDDAAVSVRTARRAVRRLEEIGLLDVTLRPTDDLDWETNVYAVNLDWRPGKSGRVRSRPTVGYGHGRPEGTVPGDRRVRSRPTDKEGPSIRSIDPVQEPETLSVAAAPGRDNGEAKDRRTPQGHASSLPSVASAGGARTRQRRDRAEPIPLDWQPNATHRTTWLKSRPGDDPDLGSLDDLAEEFRSLALQSGERRPDWDRTFGAWMRSDNPDAEFRTLHDRPPP